MMKATICPHMGHVFSGTASIYKTIILPDISTRNYVPHLGEEHGLRVFGNMLAMRKLEPIQRK
jgi:hypothetical protein